MAPLLPHEDVLLEVRRGRRVECAHCNGDPIHRGWIPEQGRAACRAESSPHLCGRLVPGQALLTRDDKHGPWHICRGKEVPGLLSALDTVACVRSTQVSRDSKAHATAET